jgi:hypothetical protein
MPRFSNRPIRGTTLSFLSLPRFSNRPIRGTTLSFLSLPRFSNRPIRETTLSFLSSRPGFPANLRWTRSRVRLSRKERRMKVASATNLNRKSGGAKPRDLRCAIRVPRSYRPTTPPIITGSSWKNQPPLCHSGFPGVVRGTADPSARSPGFPVEIGGAGELHAPFLTRKAHTQPCPAQRAGNPGRDDKKERVVPRIGRLLNRGIFQNQFGQLRSSAVPSGLDPIRCERCPLGTLDFAEPLMPTGACIRQADPEPTV